MSEKQPFFATKYPVKQPFVENFTFDGPPGDPFAEDMLQVKTNSEIPLKTAVEIPHEVLLNPRVGKPRLTLKNLFGNDIDVTTLSQVDASCLIAGLPFEQPLEQQQSLQAIQTPRPNLPDKDTPQIKESGNTLFGGSNSPIYSTNIPPRSGPLLWWQTLSDEDLTSRQRWHRDHPMSPSMGAPEIDTKRKKDEPRKPSHGRSEPYWVENE